MVTSASNLAQAATPQGDVLRHAIQHTAQAYVRYAQISDAHPHASDTFIIAWPQSHKPLPIVLSGGATIRTLLMQWHAGEFAHNAKNPTGADAAWGLAVKFIFNTPLGDSTDGFNAYGQGPATHFDNLATMIFDAHGYAPHRFGDTRYTGAMTEDHLATLATCVRDVLPLLGAR